MVMTPAERPQQGKTRQEGARARRKRRRRAEAHVAARRSAVDSHRGGPVAKPMSGAGKEIVDSVRKNHKMVLEVRANFESQLQQAEKKLEELRVWASRSAGGPVAESLLGAWNGA